MSQKKRRQKSAEIEDQKRLPKSCKKGRQRNDIKKLRQNNGAETSIKKGLTKAVEDDTKDDKKTTRKKKEKKRRSTVFCPLLMIQANFCVGNSELLAGVLICQFTVVNFDRSASNAHCRRYEKMTYNNLNF